MSARDHISVRNEKGRVSLVADDYELFDFLDDYLTERGAELEYVSEEQRDGKTFYTMHFPAGTSVEWIQRLVREIPESEIEATWEVNNTRET